MHLLKSFDRAQLWRLFVDGRFQKKFGGWVGYEEGERGSVQSWLNAFAYMLDHFDLSSGLQATYLRELHKRAMLSVETSNLKSSPGDIRYLNSGMPFFAKSTTYEHLVEVFAMRSGDGTAVFNNQRFARPADELDVDEVWAYILKEGRINYRNWYPNLDREQQAALEGKRTLHEFYVAKHAVQMLIVARMEQIVERYNRNIARVTSDEEKLSVIALVPRELELLHPFPDGNSRTFSCITLTHLLLWNGFSPTLLENPNLDNEVSHAQWIEEINKGMARFERLLAHPEESMFSYSINEMAPRDRERFLKMASEVSKRLDEHREIYLTPRRLIEYTGGRWLDEPCDDNQRFTGVGTYGTYAKGNIYFTMSIKEWEKEGKDPHAELARVLEKGMRALVVDDPKYATGIDLPVLLVDDTFEAFKRCSTAVRQALDPYTVLVTGTEGKTGAKVQFHHLLNRQVTTHAVLNSANTEVPVLRSLIELSDEDEVEINEVSVGSDETYRVERTKMVNPDLCFFTNIGPNHMDMHKTLDNIFIAKSSVVEGLREGGKCIVNADINHLPKLFAEIERRRPGTPIITYGTRNLDNATLLSREFDAERFGWKVKASIYGEAVSYFLPLCQDHAPLASVGILLAVKEMGYDVQKAARDYADLVPYQTMGRILRIPKRSGDVLFYDQSRRGAIEGVRSAFADIKNFRMPGRIIALVGGISIKTDSEWTREAHAELAGLINDSRIERLYTTGNFMDYVTDNLDEPSIFVRHSDDLDDLARSLFNEAQAGDMIFIIGSAYLYLGRVSERLLKLKDRSRFDPAINEIFLATEQIERYSNLVVQAEIEHGMGRDAALKQSGISSVQFDAFSAKYPSFIEARAALLGDFFDGIDRAVTACPGFSNVNAKVAKGGAAGYVHTLAFRRRWFNNFDKRSDLPKKQLFGSFYDFGDPEYLLHIEVATTNLHVGFVRQQSGQVVKMNEAQQQEALGKFARVLPLEPRSWGLRWVSLDYGSFIDITRAHTFADMVDMERGRFATEILHPLLDALGK
jgi:UDP-N-acetylmuramoyl-tripeptide--D-alanyl-D-alanine ligase